MRAMTKIDIDERYSFDEDTHTHYIDNKPATGITSVIGVLSKPALIPWAAKEAVKYIRENGKPLAEGSFEASEAILEAATKAYAGKRDKAASHGTDAHALVEEYIRSNLGGTPVKLLNKEYTTIIPFMDWAVANVEQFLFSERNLYDPNLFVAGIADFAFIAKDGRKYMGDFKTSSGIYGVDYFLQCAGYRILAESMGDETYDGGYIVRLGKKGPADFEVAERSGPLWEQDRACFLAALKLYRAQKQFEASNK